MKDDNEDGALDVIGILMLVFIGVLGWVVFIGLGVALWRMFS